MSGEFVELELKPTGGVIPVRMSRPGVYDLTDLSHLDEHQLVRFKLWDAYHEGWELQADRDEWPTLLATHVHGIGVLA